MNRATRVARDPLKLKVGPYLVILSEALVGVGPCLRAGAVGEMNLTFLPIGHTCTLGWLHLDPDKRKGATRWGGEFHRLFFRQPALPG